VRPKIERRDWSNVFATLNEEEESRDGRWQADNREMSSAAKFMDAQQNLSPSTLQPDEVAAAFASFTTTLAKSAS
jgi:hypothetical protein